ncbi:erythromycin esterase family protein [Dyadobacter sp. BHUBP1]|uniref:erythromycin esterase family protein n=1 Tax=Dyadobacter sp. BHUBP1 TaxID=3424178 RepID=UPI003D34EE68
MTLNLIEAEGQNKLNLSFEKSEKGIDPFLFWNIKKSPNFKILLDSTEGHNGKSAVRIDMKNNNVQESVFFYTRSFPIELFRDQIITLSVWTKTKGFKGKLGLYGSVLSDTGERLGYSIKTDSSQRENDWKKVETKIPVNRLADKFAVGVYVQGTGDVFIDDMKILINDKAYEDLPLAGTAPLADGDQPNIIGQTICLDSATYVANSPIALGAKNQVSSSVRDITLSHFSIDTLWGKKLKIKGKYTRQDGFVKPLKFYIAFLAYEDVSVYSERYRYQEFLINPENSQSGAFMLDTDIPITGYVKSASFGILSGESTAVCISDIELLADGKVLTPFNATLDTVLSEEETLWLKENSFDINIESATDQDLHSLANAFRHVRILGLGEVTHGSHELFETKAKIIRYCIGQLGFRQLILEADQVAAENVNTYLTSGKGDSRDVLRQLSYWTWQTRELQDLLEWIRMFNANNPQDKVVFAGIDMQNANTIIDALGRSISDSAALNILSKIRNIAINRPAQHSKQQSQKDTLLGLVMKLENNVEDMKIGWKDVGSLELNSSIQTYLSLLKQNFILRYAANANAYRDVCLAENIHRNLSGRPKLKTILWAHNTHISKENKPAKPMGRWLKQTYGSTYKAVGMALGSGTYRALYGKSINNVAAKKPVPGSYEYLIESSGLQNLYLDLENITLQKQNKWLFERNYLRQTGAEASDNFERQGILTSFDALIYIKRSTPTTGLSRIP